MVPVLTEGKIIVPRVFPGNFFVSMHVVTVSLW
jgi:hypothetical protein